jgi:hypothetical protein
MKAAVGSLDKERYAEKNEELSISDNHRASIISQLNPNAKAVEEDYTDIISTRVTNIEDLIAKSDREALYEAEKKSSLVKNQTATLNS